MELLDWFMWGFLGGVLGGVSYNCARYVLACRREAAAQKES